MESFAAAVGLRPQDLFGICLALFLMIIGGTIVISSLLWIIDVAVASTFGRDSERNARSGPSLVSASKDLDKVAGSTSDEEGTDHTLLRTTSRPFGNVLERTFRRYRIRPNSFHGNVLHGNLVRILLYFHLPVTIFACYQFTTGSSKSTISSVVLAVLSFVVFSVGIPVYLIVRLWNTATNKLYDETRTLMMLGPLYNHYGHGAQLFASTFFACNLVYGITIGCGQRSGTAQAVIILVTEVVSSLTTSIWLPWGRGASMGMISFCFCVARIMAAVLLVILTPTVSLASFSRRLLTDRLTLCV